MQIKDVIKNSPLRAFDKGIGGGLKPGELGVIAARSGTGKTGCIVHLATDLLLQGKKIIHVSFSDNTENTMSWYKEVYREVAVAMGKPSKEVWDEISRNRVILSFSPLTAIDKVLNSIQAIMEAGNEDVSTVILDGFKLTVSEKEDIQKIKDFAAHKKINIWASVTPVRKEAKTNEWGIPDTIEPYMDYIDVLIGLKTDENADSVKMTIAKAGGKVQLKPMKVALDSKTMLIVDKI